MLVFFYNEVCCITNRKTIMAKSKKALVQETFSNHSIELIESKILAHYQKIREEKLKDGTISQERIWSNLPSMKIIVFIDNRFSNVVKEKIFRLMQPMISACQCKVICISNTVNGMFTLTDKPVRNVFITTPYRSPILFKNVKHFIDATTPDMVMLFSTEAHITDDIYCFQIKKDEIFFTSKSNKPMEEVCLMDFEQNDEDFEQEPQPVTEKEISSSFELELEDEI